MPRLPRPLAEAAAILRAQCPPDYPVRIRLVDLPDRWGDCTLMGEGECQYFLIRLHRPSAVCYPGLAVWVCLHEWAEALSWGLDKIDHGAEFGAAYARCCRAYSLE